MRRFWLGNLIERDRLENPGVDATVIIINWMPKWQAKVASACEGGNQVEGIYSVPGNDSRTPLHGVRHILCFTRSFHHEDRSDIAVRNVGNNLQTNGLVWSSVRGCQVRILSGPFASLWFSLPFGW